MAEKKELSIKDIEGISGGENTEEIRKTEDGMTIYPSLDDIPEVQDYPAKINEGLLGR